MNLKMLKMSQNAEDRVEYLRLREEDRPTGSFDTHGSQVMNDDVPQKIQDAHQMSLKDICLENTLLINPTLDNIDTVSTNSFQTPKQKLVHQ